MGRDNEGWYEGTFELEYLGFNDVPQSLLIKYALITKVFSEYQ